MLDMQTFSSDPFFFAKRFPVHKECSSGEPAEIFVI